MKKLLALVCVIALLGALCIPTMAAANRVAVAAQVPDDWTTPYLYAWGGSETMAWPGVSMTMIDDWYVAYMNDDNANIIINNGSDAAKTDDLAIDPGLPVCVMAIDLTNVEVDVELPIEVPAEADMPKPAMDTIYAKTPDDWTTAYLYAWSADASRSNAGWPGVAMTKGDDGLWVGELGPGFANIIVTASDAGPQTVDLPYAGGNAWVALKGDNGGKLDAAVVYSEPTDWENVESEKPPVPTSDVWYVAGTMNGWNCADSAFQMTPNGDGSFSYTMSLTAGSHQLKVTNGTWDVCFGQEGGPEGNYGFDMTADGDATVNYDGNGVVTVEGENVGPYTGGETTPPVADSGNWYVAGTMNEWNCCDEAYKMTANGDGTYSYTFNVTPGDYALKVTNGTWDVSYGGDGADGNFEFNATDEGKATVKFDGSTVEVVFGEPDPVPPTEPTTKPTTGSVDGDKETEESNTGLIISIAATAVILIGGGVAVFFLLKKKKD